MKPIIPTVCSIEILWKFREYSHEETPNFVKICSYSNQAFSDCYNKVKFSKLKIKQIRKKKKKGQFWAYNKCIKNQSTSLSKLIIYKNRKTIETYHSSHSFYWLRWDVNIPTTVSKWGKLGSWLSFHRCMTSE